MIELSEIKRGLKNTSYLVGANTGIQVISFFAAIYIAKKLGPENYGIFHTATAFVAMFAFITLPGFNNTLVREGSRDVKKHAEILEKVISLQIWLSCFAILITIIAALFVSYSNNIKIYIAFLACTLLVNSLRSSLNSVYQITEQMRYISFLNIINNGLYAFLAVIFMYLGYGVFALIIISIATNFISLVLNYRIANKIIFFRLSVYSKIEKIFLKSGIIFSLISFFGFLYSRIDIVMASIFLTSKDVGHYSIALKLVGAGGMVGSMLSLAFFPIVVKKFKQGPIPAKKLYQASLLIFVIALPVCLWVSIFSKQIILLLFGEQYLGADRILRILVWVIALANPTWPFVWSMKANYHEKKVLYVVPLRSISNIVLNYILLQRFGIIGIAYSTIITHLWYMLFINFGYQLYILKKSGNIV
jgi:O-antigen/teichoic acid export membrane protein